MKGKISLIGMEFYGHHGYYASERIAGNLFVVDAEVQWARDLPSDTDLLADTVDYERIYTIVRQVMQDSHQLLETICFLIATDIKKMDPRIAEVVVTVKKNQPPLGGKVAYSAYTLTLD